MNLTNTIYWFTHSIGGIVILGACGSLFALIIKWTVGKVIASVLSPVVGWIIMRCKKFSGSQAYNAGLVQGHVIKSGMSESFMVYLAFCIVQFILAIAGTGLSLLLTIYTLASMRTPVLTVAVFSLLIVFFLFAYWAIKIWLGFHAAYRSLIKPILDKSDGKISDKEFNEFLDVCAKIRFTANAIQEGAKEKIEEKLRAKATKKEETSTAS